MSVHDERNGSGERLAHEAGRLLRRSAEELDAATLSRLNRARQNALAEFDRRHAPRAAWREGWRPALSVAAVSALAVALWVGREPANAPSPAGALPPPAIASATSQAVDLELILADENLELIEELEFYDWLEAVGGVDGDLDPALSG
jgi:hypothetical protein